MTLNESSDGHRSRNENLRAAHGKFSIPFRKAVKIGYMRQLAKNPTQLVDATAGERFD